MVMDAMGDLCNSDLIVIPGAKGRNIKTLADNRVLTPILAFTPVITPTD